MIDKNELLFVVDEQNQPLKPLPRYIVHNKGIWHRTTGIWVINKNYQILSQKRSLKKDFKPGMWEAFFGGHLHPNDMYSNNGIEELSEELGITVQKENLLPYKILKSENPTHREFQHSYLYKINREDIDFNYEKEEIDEIRWFDLDKIKNYLVTTHDPDWVHKPWDAEILAWIKNLKM